MASYSLSFLVAIDFHSHHVLSGVASQAPQQSFKELEFKPPDKSQPVIAVYV